MKFERNHYIYILIALILSLTAIAEEQTISSELANFTEINTSRIFRVYDASTSEILLSSDALYLNHVNGGINEVKITSTDTQFIHDIDMAGNNINNCGNCGGGDNLSWQNSKVNKSGREIIYQNHTTTNLVNETIWKWYNYNRTNAIVSVLQENGIQRWQLGSDGKSGAIGYSTPGGQAGIYWGNSSCVYDDEYSGNTSCSLAQIRRTSENALEISVSNSTTADYKLRIYPNGDIYLLKLIGSGNAYACIDSSGKLYRGSPTC